MPRWTRLLFAACFMFAADTIAQDKPAKPADDPLVTEQRKQVEQAKQIIEAWRAVDDERGQRPLVITLFTGSDTDPAPNYRERLTRTMRHIQQFYADEMERHGFGRLTFSLETEADELLKIHVVRGEKPNAEYSGKDGRAIREMALNQLKALGIDGNKQTVVIFCNLTKWDPATRRMSHHSPYYASGSSRQGTAWQLDSALLDSAELANTDPKLKLHDGQYGHITLGRYQSIFIGGVCHELGHALGLPHNRQRPDEQQRWGTALMGSGNFTYAQEVRKEGKGSFLTLAHAMKLAVHPGFTGSVKQMTQRPKSRYAELTHEPINEGKGVRITGKLESDTPIHAVIAYLDPEGGSDYNATTHVVVPDKNGRFMIDCTAFAKKETGRVRLVRVHANGWAQFKEDLGMDYTRDAQGRIALNKPDLSKQRADAGPGDEVYAIPPMKPCPCQKH